MRAPTFVAWLTLGLAAAALPATQDPQPSPSPSAEPDLSISATVSWRSLRFEVVGTPRVEFVGGERAGNVWEAERINLPTPVVPGVTYRDGAVRLRIEANVVALIDAALAEAAAPKVTTPTVAAPTEPQ